ncbi:MAG TPA: FKBP-type peptidyl-prolyl cis-trans isomerase [Deinococcales bacterium]|nr:FKBP-type peptidyl-prolyl cis-trans isomerase [Deinococcales bacterium]
MTRALTALAVLVALALIIVFAIGRNAPAPSATARSGDARPLCENIPAAPTQAEVENATTLQSTDTVVGTGEEVAPSSTVTVHYYGRLADGTKFDSSCDGGEPATFPLTGVIRGWQEGMVGMKVGGQRRLIIPSALAYGETGTPGGPIPPNANLVFDIELVEVE